MALGYRGLNVYILLDAVQYRSHAVSNDDEITVRDLRSLLRKMCISKVLDKYNGKP
jgi:hypothetical protein